MNKTMYFKYDKEFRKGLDDARYAADEELLTSPEVDNSSIESIGYYDGFEYGKYCVMTGNRYEIKEENLIAVIFKGYDRAVEKVDENKKVGKVK